MTDADIINQIAAEDQKLRQDTIEWDTAKDCKHAEILKSIIQRIGWPTISKVGPEASFNAWLIIQHADHDAKFQAHCLDLVKKVPLNDINPIIIPYLEDRICVNNHQPQIYGTQIQVDANGNLETYLIKDQSKIDALRATYGLGPFADYVKYCQKKNATFDGYLRLIGQNEF
jgi:hypothetical protein